MYSKIPMPQSEWTDENMSLAMCFFRGWVLLSVWRHGLSIRQEAGWLTGRKLYLLEYQAVVIFF